MQATLQHFSAFLHAAFARHFGEDLGDKTTLSSPNTAWIEGLASVRPTAEESIVFMLALAPHISPQTLDLFFIQNKELDRPYTEFGGWKGMSHNGFLPTGQTAAFLLQPENVLDLFSKEHWFFKNNILWLEGQGEGEPFLSGKIVVSEEILSKVFNRQYEPEYNSDFPAKRITTSLEWDDLVLPYNLREDIDDIVRWINHQDEIRKLWRLDRIVKPGYRCLFYGAPGTGKTLTATLLGKQNNMDVYRVDLSMIVSKYIGETEKNLAKIFDKAAHRNWILFFDEADALFGKRTETQTSNDRHANQEVAYLLQRIEDFAGMVILATNLKDNVDEAFFRRFQSALCFPVPDEPLRYQLWQKMLPPEWLPDDDDAAGNLLNAASGFKLTGGGIVNAIQNCAIKLHGMNPAKITTEILNQAVKKELSKEGKLISQSS
jgi:AAA+ superfamily predicted ATPase